MSDKDKTKLDQDQVTMILADWEHGELTKCTCECENCALNEELPIRIVGRKKITYCNMLTEMSVLINGEYND